MKRGTPIVSAPAATDLADQLKKLAELHAAGILTDDEFATKKTDLLDRIWDRSGGSAVRSSAVPQVGHQEHGRTPSSFGTTMVEDHCDRHVEGREPSLEKCLADRPSRSSRPPSLTAP